MKTFKESRKSRSQVNNGLLTATLLPVICMQRSAEEVNVQKDTNSTIISRPENCLDDTTASFVWHHRHQSHDGSTHCSPKLFNGRPWQLHPLKKMPVWSSCNFVIFFLSFLIQIYSELPVDYIFVCTVSGINGCGSVESIMSTCCFSHRGSIKWLTAYTVLLNIRMHILPEQLQSNWHLPRFNLKSSMLYIILKTHVNVRVEGELYI